MSSRTTIWFPGLRRRAGARLQLFCFPFAGGGASAFAGWQGQFPDWIEVWPLEYPGHETRLREAALTDANTLAALIGGEIAVAIERPFAFFGHSMGALLAFETARFLRRQHAAQPRHLFVSGHGDPQLPPFRAPIANLPEREFRQELRRYGGTPEAVLADEDLMRLFTPILRRDLGVCETYVHTDEPKLDFPITAFGGTHDPTVPWRRLFEWSRETAAAYRAHMLPGDHFFLRRNAQQLFRTIATELDDPRDLKQLGAPAATQVHLWRVDMNVPAETLARLRALLSADEIRQADAYLQSEDRVRFTVTRGAVRALLGRYGNLPAQSIELSRSAYGKPSCPQLWPLEFNVAHSGSMALIALSYEQSVGVDIERIRTGLDFQGIGKLVFTPNELSELVSLAAHEQLQAFYSLWVRKEAYLKCNGQGFSGSPEKTHIGLSASHTLAGEAGCAVQSFDVAVDYAAALALEKGCRQITFRYWDIDVAD